MSNLNNGEKQRDSQRTKIKLFNAVGEILRIEGFSGLGVNNIARYADVDKKLIYRYFTGPQELIESYILEKDYWSRSHHKISESLKSDLNDHGRELISDLLEGQFNYFFQDHELQKIILWEISMKSEMMSKVSKYRESIGGELFKVSDPYFNDSSVNLKAIGALLSSGIYYLILQSKNNGNSVSEMNMNNETDRNAIVKALKQIVGWAYDAAGSKQ